MHVDRRSFVLRATAALPALGLFLAPRPRAVKTQRTERPLRIRIWCEGTAPHAVYPDDIDGALADQLGASKVLPSRGAGFPIPTPACPTRPSMRPTS